MRKPDWVSINPGKIGMDRLPQGGMYMKYNFNGKDINIPDEELDKLIDTFGISMDDAIQTWLEDNDYEENEIVEEMTKKAKDNRITATIHQAKGKEGKKREVKRKEDPDKEFLIKQFAELLDKMNVPYEVTNIGKIIEFSYQGEDYKIDLIKKRKAKN